MPEDVRALFERTGAILSGHFELTSGRHSDRYVQKARVLEQPEIAMQQNPSNTKYRKGAE